MEEGEDWVNIEVMEGNLVKKIKFGKKVVKEIRKSKKELLDENLMIEKWDKYMENFEEEGCDIIKVNEEEGKKKNR